MRNILKNESNYCVYAIIMIMLHSFMKAVKIRIWFLKLPMQVNYKYISVSGFPNFFSFKEERTKVGNRSGVCSIQIMWFNLFLL